MTLSDVKDKFVNEFAPLVNKFNIHELKIKDAINNSSNEVNCPGIYVFWNPEHSVIKVGKSQSNSKKRSLQHIQDNTNKGDINMSALADDDKAVLMLFNIISDKDLHWLLSLEAFMEWNTNPSIPAGRIG